MTGARERRAGLGGAGFGAALFLAAHVIEWLLWRRWFDPAGAYPAWFLNTRGAAGFTAAWLFAAAFLGALSAPPPSEQVGRRMFHVATGAIVAMAAVLFAIGPGTIFPIVLVFGGVIVSAAVVAGTYAAAVARGQPSRRS